IKTLRFHHNRIDNFNDDGLYLTLPPRESLPEDTWIYENYITRVLTTLAFAQDAKNDNPVGNGIYIFRNVFDFRECTYGWIAKDADADAKPLALQQDQLCSDHGSPTWEPLFFYNNTVIAANNSWRDLYGEGIGSMGTYRSKRRVFNNLFVQIENDPGLTFI